MFVLNVVVRNEGTLMACSNLGDIRIFLSQIENQCWIFQYSNAHPNLLFYSFSHLIKYRSNVIFSMLLFLQCIIFSILTTFNCTVNFKIEQFLKLLIKWTKIELMLKENLHAYLSFYVKVYDLNI